MIEKAGSCIVKVWLRSFKFLGGVIATLRNAESLQLKPRCTTLVLLSWSCRWIVHAFRGLPPCIGAQAGLILRIIESSSDANDPQTFLLKKLSTCEMWRRKTNVYCSLKSISKEF